MHGLPGKQTTTLILMALAGAMLLASLGVSIATVALPALTRDFNATLPAVQWVMLAYLITITVAIVLAGKLGDLIGHRRVLIVGLTLFMLASGLCAAAPTLDMLVLGRVVQGVGGATLMALPISIAHEFVAKERIGSAMGLFGTMSAIGTALGPSLGGVLIGNMGWRAAFIMLAILGAGLLIFAGRVIPAVTSDRSPSAASPDWVGATLLTATLILYGLGTVGGDSNTAMRSTLLLVCAAGALVLASGPARTLARSAYRHGAADESAGVHSDDGHLGNWSFFPVLRAWFKRSRNRSGDGRRSVDGSRLRGTRGSPGRPHWRAAHAHGGPDPD
ncbi:MAG: MFS transporter, partial [Advenella sp.]